MSPSSTRSAGNKPDLSPGRVCYWIAVFVILAWAAKLRFSLPLAPFADADFYGYLNPAISKLTGGPFQHSVSREFLYPLFVFLNLRLGGSFHAISVSQHLLGLLTGFMLLGAWQELLGLLPQRSISPEASANARERSLLFLGSAARHSPVLLMVVAYLGRSETLFIEHTIRPEAIFPFFAALSLWLNLRFIRLHWRALEPDKAWRIGAIHLFISGTLILLRPSFGLAAIFANFPLALALWQQRRHRSFRHALQCVAIAALAASMLLLLPELRLRRSDRLAQTLLPTMRLLAHTGLVLQQMQDDLASAKTLPYDRAMLASLRDRLAAAYTDAQLPAHQPWAKLGFNPDYIYTERNVFEPFFARSDRSKERELKTFCNYYYLRAAWHRPRDMAAKVMSQLTFFYSFQHPFPAWRSGDAEPPLSLNSDRFYLIELRSFAYAPFASKMGALALGRRQLVECRRLSDEFSAVTESSGANHLRDAFWAMHLPILLAAIAATAVVFSVPRLRSVLGLFAATTLLLYTYNFGTCLTIATLFYLGEPRYIDNQDVFTLFAEFAGLLLCFQAARLLVTRILVRKPSSAHRRQLDSRGAA